MEIWKDIEGYEGFYQVSSEGRVKSLKYGKERIMKLQSSKTKNGYLCVNLCKDGKVKSYLIHRLVATAFIDNPSNLIEVNHINEIKDDNRVNNLEWCDRRYNMNYGTILQRNSIKQSIPILQFTKEGELVKKWNGTREVQRELGFYQSHISSCCKGKCKIAYGYKWCYHYKSLWEKNHIPLIDKKVA